MGKICDFRLKSQSISETIQDRPIVAMERNRKPWVADRYVTVPMTSSGPNPGFKITVYLQVEYLKNGASWDKVTVGL